MSHVPKRRKLIKLMLFQFGTIRFAIYMEIAFLYLYNLGDLLNAANLWFVMNYIGLFPIPMPSWLVMFWSSVGVMLVILLLVWSWHSHQSMAKKRS
jgi:hypothetical protein